MICSKIITPILFHAKNFVSPSITSRQNIYRFSNFKLPLPTQIDTANLTGLLSVNEAPYMTFWEKLAEFKFSSMYTGLDQFTREFLFTVANDWNLGLPLGIICVSLAIRMAFFYPGLLAQLNGMKMKDLKPHMTRYQQKMQAAQMSRNKSLMKQAQKQFNQVRKQKGIDTFVPLVNLIQIPILITWFLSLRYITNLPEVYTQLQTQSFLWIKDLSAYDPYFILPISAAVITSLSIVYSPNLSKNNVSMPFMIPFIKYLKFLPFISLPITAMFPAAINIYWCTVSLVQLATVATLHTKYFKTKVGLISKAVKPKVIQATFVEEKRSQNKINQTTSSFTSQSAKPVVNASSGPTQSIKITTARPKKAK